MKIIAELCQNHNGNLDTLNEMIISASKFADIIKIQTIRADTLTKRENYEFYRPYSKEHERLKKLELTYDDEKKFVRLCKELNVKSMTTLFTLEDIDRFNSIGYDYLKLSGYSIPTFGYGKLLKNIKFKKLFFSTSSLTLNEIEMTIHNLRKMDIDFTMLQCTCIYPTPLEKSNLQNIPFYKNHFELKTIGFSDHSNPHEDNLLVTKLAIFEGIDVLERHFTILSKDDTRDGKVSVNSEMLEEIRRFSNLTKKQQYEEINSFTDEQCFNHSYYRGRFN